MFQKYLHQSYLHQEYIHQSYLHHRYLVVEVVVSYAFEVVSSEFAKKEMENNSKLKLMTYHKFLL